MEKKRNKWKIAFWWSTIISVILLLFIVCLSLYIIIDQAVGITYRTDSFESVEKDFDNVIRIINDTDFSKNEIIKELKIEDYLIEKDTVYLNTVSLIFKKNKLTKIIHNQ
ncbi:hypothetical protein FACS18945_4400 [Bacteroidia bacterium]|nr:hypothetical protein FACS189434_02020 [Bacteroidia bacterium]GHT58488.1 hypothetical protein FACS18945_4400 [Bacteroidia bacterium]